MIEFLTRNQAKPNLAEEKHIWLAAWIPDWADQ
jgi:hypothetical protein